MLLQKKLIFFALEDTLYKIDFKQKKRRQISWRRNWHSRVYLQYNFAVDGVTGADSMYLKTSSFVTPFSCLQSYPCRSVHREVTEGYKTFNICIPPPLLNLRCGRDLQKMKGTENDVNKLRILYASIDNEPTSLLSSMGPIDSDSTYLHISLTSFHEFFLIVYLPKKEFQHLKMKKQGNIELNKGADTPSIHFYWIFRSVVFVCIGTPHGYFLFLEISVF